MARSQRVVSRSGLSVTASAHGWQSNTADAAGPRHCELLIPNRQGQIGAHKGNDPRPQKH